jgi:hypothetical protein
MMRAQVANSKPSTSAASYRSFIWPRASGFMELLSRTRHEKYRSQELNVGKVHVLRSAPALTFKLDSC